MSKTTVRNDFCRACITNNIGIIREYLDADPSLVNATDDDSEPALYTALSCECFDAARILIERGANVNAPDPGGNTPLHEAAADEDALSIFELLLEKGAEIDRKANFGDTPLYAASLNGNLPAVKKLVALGADVNTRTGIGSTPLYVALKRNNYEVADILVNNGAKPPDSKPSKISDYTRLAFASFRNDLPEAKRIFKSDTMIAYKEKDCLSPLHVAIECGHVNLARYLIRIGFYVNAKTEASNTPLHFAAKNVTNGLWVAKLLIEKEAIIDTWNKDYETPLHIAAGFGNKAVVKLLIKSGATINIGDDCGRTPLFEAIDNGYTDVALLLIKAGAAVNIRASDVVRGPLLHHAAGNGDSDMTRLLICYGADVKAVDNGGNTALHIAAMRDERVSVASLLLKRGARPNIQNNKGRTPLHFAVDNNCEKIARLLLANGANTRIKDINGKEPYDYKR